MATTYEQKTDSRLDYLHAEAVDGGRRPAGAGFIAAPGYTWKRLEITVILSRIGVHLSSFLPAAGVETAASSINWISGPDAIVGNSNMTTEVLWHDLQPEIQNAGVYRETIAYRQTGKWYLVEVPWDPSETAWLSKPPSDDWESGVNE